MPSSRGFGLLAILNLTPDSFFDGGLYNSLESALLRAGALLKMGSDVIDVGAESTRPGAKPVRPVEEQRRLLAVLAKLREAYPQATLSVDTRNSQTAMLALEAGCEIINDVSACAHDSLLLDVLAQYKPGYVLMHAQGIPETMQLNPFYDDVVDSVMRFFEKHLQRLVAAGLPESHIVLDPGIGFGKTAQHNLELIRNIKRFLEFGRPLLTGISMKSFLGRIVGSNSEYIAEATATLSALLFESGVFWHRVHEPERVGRALSIAATVN